MAMRRWIVVLLLVLSGVASAAKTMTPDQRRSELLSALSLASETELFIGQIQDHRLRPNFQIGHADYLRQSAERLSKDLNESGRDDRILAICAEQMQMLIRELTSIRNIQDEAALTEARQKVLAIKQSLKNASFGL